MRAIDLGLVLLLGVVGCGLDAGDGKAGSLGPPPETPGSLCEALNAKAVSCGLARPGANLPCEEPESQRETCKFTCFTQAPCTEFRTVACDDDQVLGPLLLCIDACGDKPFRCDSGDPLSGRPECDGFVECPDGSDEARCGGNGFYECDGHFLGWDSRCDGLPDCSDDWDERGCPAEVEPVCN